MIVVYVYDYLRVGDVFGEDGYFLRIVLEVEIEVVWCGFRDFYGGGDVCEVVCVVVGILYVVV